ncbi:hypothetical protein [Chengkuizengella marina]|uniref:Uncharacterized protein n=1 Tax=Chengkuizengella marina TaxID=2507566 RepID=A0A6N9Q563_9BACL|nr:hypothetical protein [Chengkuizengella marina]NBI29957.1 hypothetical protein [Chengkuizengella marina]
MIKQRKTGEILAVLISIFLGFSALITSHIWSITNPATANYVLLKIGSWLPGWWGIGTYAGKEMIGLIFWIVSWIVLHFILKNIQISLKKWLAVFMFSIFTLLIITWPPIYHAIWGWLPTKP